MDERHSIGTPELADVIDRSHEHDEDPLEHIGAPVHVDYDTGEVYEVGSAGPDTGAEEAP
jgi:hypothetical protein